MSVIVDGDAGVSHSHPCETAQGGSGGTGYHDSRDGDGCVGIGHPKHPPSLLVGCLR